MRLCSCIFSFNGMSELQLVLTIYYCLHNKTVPSQLTGMTVLRQVHRGAPALQVMWNAQRELPFTRYQVEISTSQDSWEEMPVNINSTEFTFESLTPGTEYHVRARAFNTFGMSQWTYRTVTSYDGEDMHASSLLRFMYVATSKIALRSYLSSDIIWSYCAV